LEKANTPIALSHRLELPLVNGNVLLSEVAQSKGLEASEGLYFWPFPACPLLAPDTIAFDN